MPLAARYTWWFVATGLVLLALFVVAPVWVKTGAMALIMIFGMVAMHCGPGRNLAPGDRRPWLLIRAAGYLSSWQPSSGRCSPRP